MGDDQPFYGVQALGIDGNHEPAHRYEDFAEFYVKEIRAVQPQGPYYIGGECLGGSLAFEVVRQLEAQGQVVNLLVMFDSYCAGVPTLKPAVPFQAYEIMFNIQRWRKLYLSNLVRVPLRQKPQVVADMFQRTAVTLRRIFLGNRFRHLEADPLSVTQAALTQAEKAYQPGVIQTEITLFNSVLPWGVTEDETLGWHDHTTGGISIERFPTLFDTLIEGADVHLAGARLREILDQKFAEAGVQGEVPLPSGS